MVNLWEGIVEFTLVHFCGTTTLWNCSLKHPSSVSHRKCDCYFTEGSQREHPFYMLLLQQFERRTQIPLWFQREWEGKKPTFMKMSLRARHCCIFHLNPKIYNQTYLFDNLLIHSIIHSLHVYGLFVICQVLCLALEMKGWTRHVGGNV